MLDIKVIRDHTAEVRRRLASRHAGDETKIDALMACDQSWRESVTESEQLKSLKNKASKEIGGLIAQKKPVEAEAKKAEVRELGERISALDQKIADLDAARTEMLLRLPNLPHPSVPEGRSAEDNPLIRVWGEKPGFTFKPASHVELCEKLRLVDFARGAKLSGSGFLLYTGWGARLERAFIQFLLDLHVREHQYTEISPPFIVTESEIDSMVEGTRKALDKVAGELATD